MYIHIYIHAPKGEDRKLETSGKEEERAGEMQEEDEEEGEKDEDEDEKDEEEDEEEEEEEDDDEDEDEEEEGSLVGSPTFGAASMDASECVHDLQLGSPPDPGRPQPRDAAKDLSSYVLPRTAAAATVSRRGSSLRPGNSAVTAAEGRGRQVSAPAGGAAAAAAAASAASAQSGGSGPEGSGRGGGERQQKLVLMLNGQPLPCGVTIFQAIRQFGSPSPTARELAAAAGGPAAGMPSLPASLSQRLWGAVYTLTYRLPMEVDELGGGGGRGSVEPAGSGRSSEGEEGVRCAVEAHVLPPGTDPLLGALGAAAPPLCAESEGAGAVLKLLWFLHRLNEHWARLYSTAEVPEAQRGAPALPPAVFPNSKLNAKLMRQLQDPLALCSRSFPSWCPELVNACLPHRARAMNTPCSQQVRHAGQRVSLPLLLRHAPPLPALDRLRPLPRAAAVARARARGLIQFRFQWRRVEARVAAGSVAPPKGAHLSLAAARLGGARDGAVRGAAGAA